MNQWTPAWHCVSPDYNQDLAVFENITQRCLFTNNLRGSKVRIRFSNLYNNRPVTMEHVAVATCNRLTGRQSSPVAVTLNGNRQIRVAPNARPCSDEIFLPVTPEDDLLVWQYFGQKTVFRSVCTTSTWHSWQSTHHTGNFFAREPLGFTLQQQLAPALAADPTPCQFAAGLSEVSVLAEDSPLLVALFGDSITQMSYFSDCLLAELYRRFPGKCALINGGIAGNRIQKSFPDARNFPGGGHQFGIAGRDRFVQDLYDGMTPDLVFVLEGVNDCSHSLVFHEPDVPSSRDIYGALTQVVDIAHRRGSRVCLCTIPPFGAFGEVWRDQAEALRCACNDLIRADGLADKVLDLDAVLRDPDDPHRMQAGLHLGDGVHPNWKGGAKMARAVLDCCFAED